MRRILRLVAGPGTPAPGAAILAAAREQFADHGYDGATIRAIAAAVGVDPAHRGADSDPEVVGLRAALVAVQLLGLALSRYVLQFGPVAQASADELAAAVGPAIDR